MLEIQPVLPPFPIVKPQKIKKDDHPPERQPRRKKPEVEKQDIDPIQHIDEIA